MKLTRCAEAPCAMVDSCQFQQAVPSNGGRY
jgi:hypothetical protein